MSGSNAHANLGPDGPSKAAVIMLVKVLAQELGRDGIRVNSVSPGMVRTGMTEKVYENEGVASERDGLVPIGRVAVPEDIADVVVFLLGRTRATSLATTSWSTAASAATSWDGCRASDRSREAESRGRLRSDRYCLRR
jgi:NAD(P)-dependent dehydrogenase (short-subunit alcohol dehydrogenase family)